MIKMIHWGQMIALGVSWHMDHGFWKILGETLLGWVYVSYKITQHVAGYSMF